MVASKISKAVKEKADQLCQEGLDYYAHWDIERAIEALRSAIALNSREADYFLYLAQAYVRLGDYESMRRALGEFMHLESDPDLTDRFEMLFGNAMDDVETLFTHIMTQRDAPLEIIGAAIQMWVEFRVALGRKHISLKGGEARAWAAALDYTIRKVNFHEVPIEYISRWYDVSSQVIRSRHAILVEILDVMPCDYRYFRGPENPLDKLVEAANMLEKLEERFYRL